MASGYHVREQFYKCKGEKIVSDDDDEGTVFLVVKVVNWHLMIMLRSFFSSRQIEKMAPDDHVSELFLQLSGWKNGI